MENLKPEIKDGEEILFHTSTKSIHVVFVEQKKGYRLLVDKDGDVTVIPHTQIVSYSRSDEFRRPSVWKRVLGIGHKTQELRVKTTVGDLYFPVPFDQMQALCDFLSEAIKEE